MSWCTLLNFKLLILGVNRKLYYTISIFMFYNPYAHKENEGGIWYTLIEFATMELNQLSPLSYWDNCSFILSVMRIAEAYVELSYINVVTKFNTFIM